MKGSSIKERSKCKKAQQDDARYKRLTADLKKKEAVKVTGWDTYLLSDT